jgi:antitoxin PrlF
MSTAILGSQGRVTIPIQVRIAMGLHKGQIVAFEASQGGFKLVVSCCDVTTLRGRFAGRVNKSVNLAEMDAAITAGATRRIR